MGEEDFKEEMEEDFKEEMVVEEMVEDKEAMDPKIANILNVTKTIQRVALEEVWPEETIKGAEGPNVNRILMEKITATSSQIAFGTEKETGETEDIDDFILILSSNAIKLLE